MIQAGLRAIGVWDLDLLEALHARCFEQAWDRTAFARFLAMPGTFGTFAESGTDPIGFGLAHVVADHAEILALCVAPEQRRRGHGQALLVAIIAGARDRGAAALFLEVSEENEAARQLYEAAGFIRVGYRSNYYRTREKTSSAVVMKRAVQP